jgi:hypothetical protein
MNRVFLAILFMGILAGGVTQAVADESEPYSLSVIIGGGRTEEDAQKAINDFLATDAAKVRPVAGFPKVFSAEDLKGFPPDTYVAVLGFCDPEKSGKLVKRMIHVISTGAYSKPIIGQHESSCPSIAPELEQPADPPRKTKKKR